MVLRLQGWSISAIARQLPAARSTVRLWLSSTEAEAQMNAWHRDLLESLSIHTRALALHALEVLELEIACGSATAARDYLRMIAPALVQAFGEVGSEDPEHIRRRRDAARTLEDLAFTEEIPAQLEEESHDD